ncbi:MAG TPA: PIG-L deacetylase family protein [Candidatus Dormibacteraeota bacterium]|jgi:LmbE family N-acetylglucosaminyl deacetylase|nr:PIG-L deacetylase family protein [Candidatus Dormibacteraeota bacterium]
MRFKGLTVERAMAIYAHPDDAEFGMAGTVARWTRAGVELTYVLITNGASGSQDPKMTRKRLAAIRKAEQDAAAKILGVKRVVYLGYEDGYLYPTLEVRRDVARVVRQYRPDVILTMDPTFRYGFGYVNHPDHIAAAEVVMRTINPDASTRQMFPELWTKERLEPHKPRALLLAAFNERADTIIDISPTLELKLKALRAHASQVGDGFDDFVRDFGRRIGKTRGYRYGESYQLLKLDETQPPRRRARRRT